LLSVAVPPLMTLAGKVLMPSSPSTCAGCPVLTSRMLTVAPSTGSPLTLSNTIPNGSTSAWLFAGSVLSNGSV